MERLPFRTLHPRSISSIRCLPSSSGLRAACSFSPAPHLRSREWRQFGPLQQAGRCSGRKQQLRLPRAQGEEPQQRPWEAAASPPEQPPPAAAPAAANSSSQAPAGPAAELGGMLSRLWASLQRLWDRHVERRALHAAHQAFKEAPKDVAKFAAYLQQLNRWNEASEVVELVESREHPASAEVAVEYMEALARSGQLARFAANAAGQPQLAPGEAHRSLPQLLRELQGLAAGQGGDEEPGASARRPVHVYLQGGLPASGSGGLTAKPPGALQRLLGALQLVALLLVMSVVWLVGSQAFRRAQWGLAAGGGLPPGAMAPGMPGNAAAASGLQGPNGGMGQPGGNAAIEPKEYRREEMPEKSVKTFKDVIGCDESKEELAEVVEFLKHPERFSKLGAKLPKGVLLTGPPGTGKTLLAKAVAGEAGVPFFFRSGSEFEELYVGVGARRMRALFAAAKKKAPCIVFIDEVDAIGGNRKHWENHTRKTLNQMLVEMDGFEANEGVIVMAATNMPETLDPALKRPGRFDRQVAVPLPDIKGRTQILDYYLGDKPTEGVDSAVIARQTGGFSGADLANLVNEAALQAAKQGASAITGPMVDSAYDKIKMGVERKSAVRNEDSRRNTAFHEAGHALVALRCPGASRIHKATIVPRGHALGMVSHAGRDDEFSITRQQMVAQIQVCMGGTVAEELVFGRDHVTSGATDDLRQANALARHFVAQCGLSDAVGPVYISDRDSGWSEALKQQVDAEVRAMVTQARAQVKALLSDNLKDLHTLANALLEHETLTLADIQAVLRGEALARPPPTAGGSSKAAEGGPQALQPGEAPGETVGPELAKSRAEQQRAAQQMSAAAAVSQRRT